MSSSSTKGSTTSKTILLWFLFFAICWGLGYPTLSRYDPRGAAGTRDSVTYYDLVTGMPQESLGFRGYRLLVPSVARPFYHLAAGRLRTWDPVFFSLLIANALFCCTTACLLVSLGRRVVGDYSVALLGAALYLLNFTVSNSQLSGMVDSGEACLMMGLGWSLFAGKWPLLPILGVLGALAKETFVPLSTAFAVGWYVGAAGPGGFRLSQIGWIAALATTGLATVSVLQSFVSGHAVWPWNIVSSMRSDLSLSAGFLQCVLDHNFWYPFVWLLPLGAFRLGRLHGPWLRASVVSALTALALGAYHDAGGGNVARSMFNVIGPILSLSAASLLSGWQAKAPNSEET